jgi:hypothetical protein
MTVERMTKRVLRSRHYFERFIVFVVVVLFYVCPNTHGQDCTSEGYNVEAALQNALSACDPTTVYRVSAQVGVPAIPALRKILESETSEDTRSRCGLQISRAAQNALAKLGNEGAFQQIAQEFKKSGDSHARLQDLTFVGDDRAISVLLDYLADHPRLSPRQDAIRSAQLLILGALGEIGQRRILPDVSSSGHHPTVRAGQGSGSSAWTADELIPAWAEWWEGHRNSPISTAPYEVVSDSRLRCLARKVDWGFSEAILEIADFDGEGAKELLGKFPNSQNWGIPSIPGYVCLALARLGDHEKWQLILNEWEHGSDFTDAVEKLEYIGGKDSVELLIERFPLLDARGEAVKKRRDECVKSLLERYRPRPTENVQKYIQNSWCSQNYEHDTSSIELERAELLKSLGKMVKNPPLSADVLSTQQNIQIWKDWWQRSQDRAEFMVRPLR